VILQIGSFFSSLVSGIGSGISSLATAIAPGALDIGKQFLQREVNRKLRTREQRRGGAAAVAALNTPGISVARVGGTIQPVGGRVQRSTFTPAAQTPAQNPFGNIPLLPVGGRLPVIPFGGPFAGFGTFKVPPPPPIMRTGMAGQGPLNLQFQVGGLNGFTGPKFAKDEMGRTIMFVPSPRPGEGFISVMQARQLNLMPTRPFWRFNRKEGQFEKIKPRRLNPFNFRALSRAGRRVERSLDAVKDLVRIERKMTSGKVRLKRRKKRKR